MSEGQPFGKWKYQSVIGSVLNLDLVNTYIAAEKNLTILFPFPEELLPTKKV
ncbi:hypothetical protein HER15_02075 [Tenacibaculum mesophilum]|uniref:Uncharacterized protein n=2 Tax=Tenacibaculum TaxID=104267 RepID=A0AAE9MJD6_9FLAO|nr:hypothetical protein [Tenacibaculum mesophilum]UTD13946.1 hypothetical protein HER15_02075 [Tenacibaculum mesophilum]